MSAESPDPQIIDESVQALQEGHEPRSLFEIACRILVDHGKVMDYRRTDPKDSACPGCANSLDPSFLDDGGFPARVSGRPGKLGHSFGRFWWHCEAFDSPDPVSRDVIEGELVADAEPDPHAGGTWIRMISGSHAPDWVQGTKVRVYRVRSSHG